jgi:hypothetical protein
MEKSTFRVRAGNFIYLIVNTVVVVEEGFPSGQREQTVNLPALPSKVRILPPPPFLGWNTEYTRV